MEKLQTEENRKKYRQATENMNDNRPDDSMNKCWTHIKEGLITSAKDIIGIKKIKREKSA